MTDRTVVNPNTPLTFHEARLAALEAENRRLSADASWAATHRSELADLRAAFAKAEARLKAADAMEKALEAVWVFGLDDSQSSIETVALYGQINAALAAYRESAQ